MENIALDVHKHYTWARVENTEGQQLYASRLAHSRGCIKNFVQRWTPGSPVAVETVGNWYWVVDEIEAGGGKPQLVNARLAKLMIGNANKSDKHRDNAHEVHEQTVQHGPHEWFLVLR